MESSIHRNLVRKLTSLKINESFRKENVSVSFEVQTLEILGACAIHHLYEKFENVKKKSLQSCQPMHILFLIRVYLPYDYFTYLVISVSIWWMNRLFIILIEANEVKWLHIIFLLLGDRCEVCASFSFTGTDWRRQGSQVSFIIQQYRWICMKFKFYCYTYQSWLTSVIYP